MPYHHFIWTDETIEHLAEHGVSPQEFEQVVRAPVRLGYSRSSDHHIVKGYTAAGRYLLAVYEPVDELVCLPITAYDIPEP